MPDAAMKRYRCTSAERLMAFVHDVLRGDSIVTTVARCRTALNPERLRIALARLQERHAKLRCSLTSAIRTWPEFVVHNPAPPIPLKIHTATHDESWREVMLKESVRPFATKSAPLVRLCLVEHPESGVTDLIGWFHHAALDGLSTWRFYQELLLFYADPEFALPEAPGGFAAGLPGPAWYRGMRLKIFPYLYERQIERFREKLVRPPVECRPPGSFHRWIWSEEETSRLVQQCRANKVTMYHALTAAGSLALRDHYRWTEQKIACLTPINIRAQLDPPVGDEVLGNFVASSRTLFELSQPTEDFWSTARRFSQAWDEQLQKRDPIEFLRVMATVFMFRFMVAFHGGALTVNNLGRLNDLPDNGQPRIENFTWFGRSTKTGAICHINAVTVQGRLNLGLRAERLSDPTLRKIGEGMQEHLYAALGTTDLAAPKFLGTTKAVLDAGVLPTT